jgi:hypothetical protein
LSIKAGSEDWATFQKVYLREDGNLVGRLTTLNASDVRVPVRGYVLFIRKRRVVARAESDEWGRFQVVGLPPAVYSVIARGKSVSSSIYDDEAPPVYAAVSERIVTYEEGAPKGQYTFDLSLITTAAEKVGEEAALLPAGAVPPVEPEALGDTGAGAGGAGGDGAALAALLGAGLGAGVGAATGGGNSGPAPSGP